MKSIRAKSSDPFSKTSVLALLFATLGAACADVDAPEAIDAPEVAGENIEAQPHTAALQSNTGDPNLKPRADLKIVSLNGTGCPPGTVTTFYNPESKTGVIQFSDYALDITASQRNATKNCIINIDVSHEKGLAYAVTRVQYRGYAILPPGTKGVLDTDYTFAGLAQSSLTQQKNQIPNVEGEPWAFVHDVQSRLFQFSDCAVKRTLTMRTRLTLTNSTPGQDGHLDMESVEASLMPIEFNLTWRPCSFN